MGVHGINEDLNAAKQNLGEGLQHLAAADNHRSELTQFLGLVEMALQEAPKIDPGPTAYEMLGNITLTQEAYRTGQAFLERAKGDTSDTNTYLEQASQCGEQFVTALQKDSPIYQELVTLDQEVRGVAQDLARLFTRATDAYERAGRAGLYFRASKTQVVSTIDTITDFQQQNDLPPA